MLCRTHDQAKENRQSRSAVERASQNRIVSKSYITNSITNLN